MQNGQIILLDSSNLQFLNEIYLIVCVTSGIHKKLFLLNYVENF